jgi:hypothetical protein
LRSAAVQVKSEATTVRLAALEPQPVTLMRDGAPVPLTQLAVRSAGVRGEARWKRPDTDAEDEPAKKAGRRRRARNKAANEAPAMNPEPPSLVLSPNDKVGLCLIGESEPTYLAIWRRVSPADLPKIVVSEPSLSTVRIKVRDGTPPLRSAEVRLEFPDCEIAVPAKPETLVLTNRRFAQMGYTLEAADGAALVFAPRTSLFPPTATIYVGGALTPWAWTHTMVSGGYKEPTVFHAAWGAGLRDESGSLLSAKQSKIGWSAVASIDGGKTWATATSLFEDNARKAVEPLLEKVRVKVKWDLGSSGGGGGGDGEASTAPAQERILDPTRFVPFKSEHYELPAPSAWEGRATDYLRKLERVHSVLVETTGRPGPNMTHIQWRLKGGLALSGASGPAGRRGHMSMPFSGLSNDDCFDLPWAFQHEMLHTFRYPHGETMDEENREGSAKYGELRWYLVDHVEAKP